MWTDYARCAHLKPFLLPIIPANAKISLNSGPSVEKNRGKIPGVYDANAGRWAGMKDWSDRPGASDADVAQWSNWPDAGIGVRTGKIIAIDVDVTDEQLSLGLLEFIDGAFGGISSPVRIGRRPKFLLAVRAAAGEVITKMRLAFEFNGARHAVEILGRGQQFVAEGVHPKTGKPYQWKRGTLRDMLIEVTAEDLKSLLFEKIAKFVEERGGVIAAKNEGSQGGDVVVDQESLKGELDLVQSALDALPNQMGYDDWVTMGMAVKAACGEDGWEPWLRWSQSTHGETTVEYARERWESFRAPFRVGADYVYGKARSAGWTEGARAMFEPVHGTSGVPPGAGGSGAAASGVGADRGGEDVERNQSIFARYVYLEQFEQFFDLYTSQRLSPMGLNRRHTELGHPSSRNAASYQYWNDLTMRRMYSSVTYAPGKPTLTRGMDGAPAVNLWAESKLLKDLRKDGLLDAKVADADVEPFLAHGRWLYGDAIEPLWNWMAWILQFPDEKVNWMPVLGGKQGVGKDTLLVPLQAGIGQEHVIQASTTMLESPFNSFLANKKLVLVQEMHSFQKKEASNTLKQYIATPPLTISINEKFQTPYEIENLVQLAAVTNNEDALYVESTDRRYYCLWSENTKQDSDYYARLINWLKGSGGSGIKLVVRWLMQRDLRGFDAKGQAPWTQAKEDMRAASLGVVEAWFEETIKAGQWPFDGGVCGMGDVLDSANIALGMRGHSALTAGKTAAHLRRVGWKPVPKTNHKGRSIRVWRSPDVPEDQANGLYLHKVDDRKTF